MSERVARQSFGHRAMAATGRALPAAASAPRVAERLAEATDAAEAAAFDRIRSRFVEAVAENMDVGHGVAGAAQQPDHLFCTLMEIATMAARETPSDLVEDSQGACCVTVRRGGPPKVGVRSARYRGARARCQPDVVGRGSNPTPATSKLARCAWTARGL